VKNGHRIKSLPATQAEAFTGETSLRSSLITRSTPQTKTNNDHSFVVTVPLLAAD
jgi:hypothetical protein